MHLDSPDSWRIVWVVAGALSAALIPVFQSYRAKADEAEAWRLASSVINLVVIALSAFSLLMAIFAPWIVPLITPGFDAPTTELTIRMTRIMLLSPVFIGMGAVVSWRSSVPRSSWHR